MGGWASFSGFSYRIHVSTLTNGVLTRYCYEDKLLHGEQLGEMGKREQYWKDVNLVNSHHFGESLLL